MNPSLSRRFRLHLRWLILTAAIGVVCLGLYASGAVRGKAMGGTPEGIALGILAAVVVVFASCYGVRRRVGLKRLRDTLGRIDPEREKRLADLNETIADLQVAGTHRGDSAADLQRQARAAVKEAGLRGQIHVEVLKGPKGRPLLRLVPGEHPGRLENWLMAHQYLGVLVVLLVVLHAGWRFQGTLSVVTTVLGLALVASGVLVSLLYVLGPRLLVRLEARGGGDEKRAGVLAVAASLMLGMHVALTGALLGALVVHVFSILYY